MKIHKPWVILLISLWVSSCLGTSFPSTNTTGEALPDNNKIATSTIPSQNATQYNQFSSAEELSQEVLQEVVFFAGGAGCGIQNIGVSEKKCMTSMNWPVTLSMTGIYRVSGQGTADQYPWWGNINDSCYENINFGDMVYFTAQGYPPDENVQFLIQGPNGSETYNSKVQPNVQYYADSGDCSVKANTAAARLSWVAIPELGAGQYKITASGKNGKSELSFFVTESLSPNFGVSVGSTSLPLVFDPTEEIKVVYSGFQPYETVRTLLYYTGVDIKSEENSLVGYIDFKMDKNGSKTESIKWDTTFPRGKYWLLVPKTLPTSPPTEYYGINPVFSSIYFYAGIPPVYDPNKLKKEMKDLLLRPSCGTEISINGNPSINLIYGIWGVNGLDLLEETKNDIITRLFINGEEVVGYRSNNVIPMSEMPCGNNLENGYFLYSESQIGPLLGTLQDIYELDIRVDYSFNGTITDGYDFSPKDGIKDIFSPSTPFSQTYVIKIIP